MWVEEALIGEGYWASYFQIPEHKILRFLVKGMGAVIIFGTGYYGLSTLPVKWIKDVWLYWYGLAFFAVGLRIVLVFFLVRYFNYNRLTFLSSIYYITETPFPYLFLWLLSVFVRRENKVLKKQTG